MNKQLCPYCNSSNIQANYTWEGDRFCNNCDKYILSEFNSEVKNE